MKREKNVTVDICDFCKKREANYSSCFGCGKVFCYECEETHIAKYNPSVYFSGSGDGYYCASCDVNCHGDKLHQAYVYISNLAKESRDYYDRFKKRADQAEEHLKELLKERSENE